MKRSTVKKLTEPLDEPEREFRRLRRAALRQHQNESLAIAGRNLFDDEASSSNDTKTKPITPLKTLREHSLPNSAGFQNPILLPAKQTGRIVNSRDILLIQGTCTFQGLKSENPLSKDIDLESAHMVAASKVPMLKPENGNSTPKTIVVEGVEKVIPPTTVEENAKKRLEGNAATKKTQRNLLKQQYENFSAPSSETLDQTYDRIQKLVSQLEILGEKLSQEDVNQKLLRSLSPEWNIHIVVWRNKHEL
ncbi:hypothetical protein Tco_1200820 [Tanacetum coccineum]